MTLSPGVRLGPYEVVAPLGAGGMGEVSRARDTRLGRDVALKVLPAAFASDPDRRARLEREARVLAALNHPHIVTIYAVEEFDGLLVLAMECLEGRPLSAFVQPGGLSLEPLLHIAGSLADALAAAHQRGVVHRDLKPANVTVSAAGWVKVLDFGLAKPNEESPGSTLTRSPVPALTLDGTILGTAAYMSPEQAQGLPVDHVSDIFSLGVVLYDLATGRRPFTGDTPLAVLSSILKDRPTPITSLRPDLPVLLGAAIDRCLQKEPRDRFQSAADLGHVFELVRRTDGDSVGTPEAVGHARSRAGLVRAVALVMFAVLAGLGIAAWMTAHRNRASAAAPIDSIAVLPLENLSANQDEAVFVDGITDALITELSKIRALRVVSRTSVMRYRKTQKSAAEIGKELRVGAVVEGSVERAGSRVRVSAQSIRTDTDRNLWADLYDRELRDVLLLQDDVARAIARQVQVTLTPEDQARLSASRPVDPSVYEVYITGRFFWNKRTEASIGKAMEYFRRAIDKDATYGAAFSGLADCYSSLGFSFDTGVLPPNDAIPKAKDAVREALALQEDMAEAHNSLAFIHLNYDWDWPASEAEFKRSLDLNPGYANAHHWYAHYLISRGRFDQALEESKRAIELDQLNPIMNTHLGWDYYYARQYDPAIEQLRKTLDLEPDYGLAHWYMGLALEGLGQHDRAIEELGRGQALLPGNVVILGDLGYAYAAAGRRADAERIIWSWPRDRKSTMFRRTTPRSCR